MAFSCQKKSPSIDRNSKTILKPIFSSVVIIVCYRCQAPKPNRELPPSHLLTFSRSHLLIFRPPPFPLPSFLIPISCPLLSDIRHPSSAFPTSACPAACRVVAQRAKPEARRAKTGPLSLHYFVQYFKMFIYNEQLYSMNIG